MSEPLYSLSTIGGELLWESGSRGPIKPEVTGNDIVDLVDPLYFDARDMLTGVGLTIPKVRDHVLAAIAQRPRTQIRPHPTVLEDPEIANTETSLWYLPSHDLTLPGLDGLYRGPMLAAARIRHPDEPVEALGESEDPYCFFVTEVLPKGSRMDLHKDGRRPVTLINFSEPENRGRSFIGHPDLLQSKEPITVAQLLEDERTLVQRLSPGCGVSFDVTETPHLGASDPGTMGYRIIMDADYRTVGKPIDDTVYDSYQK